MGTEVRRPGGRPQEDRGPGGSRSGREDEPAGQFRAKAPTVIATATVVVGLLAILSALTPERHVHLVTRFVPLGIAQGASAATVVVGVLLVMLGHGLRRRKRRAWRISLVLATTLTVLHVVKGPDLLQALVSLALVIVLLRLSDEFYAQGDPRTRLRAPVVFLALLGSSFVLGYLLLLARGRSITGSPSVLDRLQHVAYGLVGVAGPVRFRQDGTGDLVFAILVALGALTLIVPAYLLLRAPEPAPVLSGQDEADVRELLRRHGGCDSLGYFALRSDKSVVFSRSRKAAVSYRVVSGVMLASGDPLGEPEAWPGAIAAFLAEARRHAWVPAVMACSERGGEVWVREAGLRALELGDEAVLDIADFTLEGRPMRNLRQMVGRVERAGYVTAVRRARDIPADELAEIGRQAHAWRGAEVERGFSMALGRFGSPADPDSVVVTVHREGTLAALLSYVPWGDDGLSLDMMRRDRAADPGLNELMIVETTRAAPALGVRRLSLNFAVFRATLERGGRIGAGPVTRAWRGFLLWLSRWFQIESLFRFNAKFRPTWEPRFVCYPRSSDLPRITMAALEAEAFIVWPKPRWATGRSEGTTPVGAGTGQA